MNQPSNEISLICSEIIGREQELRKLDAALSHAASGQPQFLWISGEAGIGKTKLCHTFIEISQVKQAVILYGQAISQDQVLPFSPFLDLFRRHFIGNSKLLTPFDMQLWSTFSFLREFLPDCAQLFNEISSPTLNVATSEPTQRRQMLFYQILRELETLTLTCQGPLVLILEDLHWADETSLELLVFLAQRLSTDTYHARSMPSLLFVGTYRPGPEFTPSALQRVLAQLYPLRSIQMIQLTPLNAAEHRRCVRSILHAPVPEVVTNALFKRDDGNPFFIEELLGSMVTSGQLQVHAGEWTFMSAEKPFLPMSLISAILDRFQQLSSVDQDVLNYAAVIGQVFDFPLLAVLCNMDERKLIEVLRRAVQLQLIHEVDHLFPFTGTELIQEQYRFRHALTWEAIYEHMLQSERRFRHRVVAETIEKSFLKQAATTESSDDVVRRQHLVRHYNLAGMLERAYPYASQEADRAHHTFAFSEEGYYLDLAQASLPANSPKRLYLLERLGMVHMGIYNFSTALHWFSLAKEGYQHIGQPSRALQILALMLLPTWFLASSELSQMLVDVEEAIERAFANPVNQDIDLLGAASISAMYQVNLCQYNRLLDEVARNIKLFDTLTDPHKIEAIQISYIARCWAQAHQHSSDIERCIAELHSILETAHQQQWPNVLMLGYLTLIMVLIFWGKIDEAEQVTVAMMDYEKQYGTLRTGFIIGWKYFYAGKNWEQGIDFLYKDRESRKHNKIWALLAIYDIILIHFLIARRELPEAQVYLQEAQLIIERINEPWYSLWLGWGFAKFYQAKDDHILAQEWYNKTLEQWERTEEALFIQIILLDGIIFYANIDNFTCMEKWLSHLQAVTATAKNPIGFSALQEAQGIVLAKKNKLLPAIEILRRAVEAWDQLHFRYQYALAAQRLAELLLTWVAQKTLSLKLQQNIRKEAENLLNCAYTVYKDINITDSIETIQSLRMKTHLNTQQKRRHTLKTRQGGGLTPREKQILTYIASGLSNKEIAKKISISIGTVENHITHILTKLNCRTRTQAAIYAVEQGWMHNLPGKEP